MALIVKEFTEDLDERIKAYLTSKGEEWDTDKHFIYITKDSISSKLIFDTWLYKCPTPTYEDLGIVKSKIILRKKVNGN